MSCHSLVHGAAFSLVENVMLLTTAVVVIPQSLRCKSGRTLLLKCVAHGADSVSTLVSTELELRKLIVHSPDKCAVATRRW